MHDFWKYKRVLITGDTGFKGSWLTVMLLNLGSFVSGISLKAEESNILYKKLLEDDDFNYFKKESIYQHHDLDIRNGEELKRLIEEINPEIIFHLAAQPLVRESYLNPLLTWETNVIGTINLLESLRGLEKCSVVVITTDKVYENVDWNYSYRENDILGGHDPYSSSKASVEIAVSSWRNSFFKKNIKISTARAGNVIGGGDWAKDRIVPDTIDSLVNDSILEIRYPNSVRPWQHVLDPLWAYMELAKNQIYKDLSPSYNFGPLTSEVTTVKKLVNLISDSWGKEIRTKIIKNQPIETSFLSLSIDKSIRELNWLPKWNLKTSIKETVKSYKELNSNISPFNSMNASINSFLNGKNIN